MTSKLNKSVLVFEWLTGGGLAFAGESIEVDSPMFRQGMSMRTAVVEDFVKAGLHVATLVDERIAVPDDSRATAIPTGRDLEQTLRQATEDSDFVLVIAPECEGILLRCSEWLAGQDEKRLFPSHDFIKLCSNKKETLKLLSKSGLPTPASVGCSGGRRIVKPNFGCGSEGIQVVDGDVDLGQYTDPDDWFINSDDWLVEPFIEGVPASVSVIEGEDRLVLRPLRQVFDEDPVGSFVAAVDDLSDKQTEFVRKTAVQVCDALPATIGYFGIDMVVDEDKATVIEVNPRLTDSYQTLQKIHDFNLAEKMIELATSL